MSCLLVSEAVLRRQTIEAPGAPSAEDKVIEFGEFILNLGTREMFRGEEPMPLTSGEFAVLKALVTNAREPMSRDKLMNMARGREYSVWNVLLTFKFPVYAVCWKKTLAAHVIFKRFGD